MPELDHPERSAGFVVLTAPTFPRCSSSPAACPTRKKSACYGSSCRYLSHIRGRSLDGALWRPHYLTPTSAQRTSAPSRQCWTRVI